MSSHSRFKRVSRRVIDAAVFAAGLLLAWRLVRHSPILLGASVLGIGGTLWWFRRRELRALGYLRGRFQWRDLLLAGLLVSGLWLALYLVFSLGDVGFSSGSGTRIPIGRDAAPLSIGDVLMAGWGATICAMSLAFPFRGVKRNRSGALDAPMVGSVPGKGGNAS